MLPSADTALCSQMFSRAAAALISLPNPVCADMSSWHVENRRMDRFGNQVYKVEEYLLYSHTLIGASFKNNKIKKNDPSSVKASARGVNMLLGPL